MIDLVFLAVRRLVAHFSAVVTNYRLLVNFIVAAGALWLWCCLLMAPVFLVREVGQLLQRALLINDDRFKMLVLAVRPVRTEAHHVVYAYLLLTE